MRFAIGACFVAAISYQATTQNRLAPLTVLRIAAGPHGEVRNGDFVLDEERTQFDSSKDRAVVVYFQWQGQPGVHRMTALWKSPAGAMLTTSPVEYEAKDRRFGAFWSLTLSEEATVGTWSIEATVDGQPGGRFTFEIVPRTAGRAAPDVKRVLTQAELFSRASAAFVVLERTTSKGERLEPAAAFVAGHGRLFTSVAAVDGADVMTALLPDGKRQPITAMLAMHRAQDWIVLAGGPEGEISQPLASETTTQVGDRVFSLESSGGASRVLIDSSISGRAGSPASGPRLLTTIGSGSTPPGEPVFNDFGELIGITGGSLVPGASELSDLMHFRAELHGVPVIPISLIRAPLDLPPVSLAEVRAKGALLAAVQGFQNVLSGGFARGINKTQSVVPADQRNEFSAARDKDMIVFVTWSPQTRLKGSLLLKLYDETNRLSVDSKPGKLDVRPGSSVLSNWKLPIPSKPGMYRAEVLVEGTPIWRGFVRITE